MAEKKLEVGKVYSTSELYHEFGLQDGNRLDSDTVFRFDREIPHMIFVTKEMPGTHDEQYKIIRIFNLTTCEVQKVE